MSTIHEKLVAIQSDLKAPKNQTNAFGKYKYRSCEDILEAAKPLLKEHGLVLTLSDEVVFIAGGAPQSFTMKEWNDKAKQMVEATQIIGGDRFYVKTTAAISDGEQSISVSAYAREEQDKRGMDGAQITGAASSYARKYALNGLFCIDDTKDSDATNDHSKQNPVSAAPAAKPQTIVGKSSNPTPKPTTIKVMESMTEATSKDQLEKLWARANAYAWSEADMNSIRSCYTNTLARL